MALAYLLSPTFEFVNTAGKPLTGGWLEVYIAGSREKYYCASDFSGTLHPFRIPLDSLGANVVLAEEGNSYDVYAYNRYGSLSMSRYNVKPGSGGGISGDSITSSDGSIIVTQTGDGVDLKVNAKAPTVMRCTASDLTGDGAFQFSELQRDGTSARVDSYTVKIDEGWWHFDAVARLRWSGEVNGTQSVSLYTANGSDSMTFDMSYPHSETVNISGELKAEQDGTSFVLGVLGVPVGMTVSLVDFGIHSIVGEGASSAYTAGNGIIIDNTDRIISIDPEVVQEKLTAGTGIDITNNVISATAAQQLNADWDATSGVQEILNKPDLSQYATTTDLAGKADKVTGATAGDIAVLDATGNLTDTGVSATDLVHDSDYVHTDNNFTDADASKLSGIESGAQANVQADWNQTDTSADDYIKNKPTIPPSSVVDQTYNPSSTNAQSGTAVAGAISGVNQVPSSTSGDSGKVLTVDSQGNPEWADVQAPISAGTGIDITNDTVSVDFTEVQAKLEAGDNITIVNNVISATAAPQLNADWDATSGVQEILHKPDLSQYATQTDLAGKQDTLTAGSNITIVNDVISATAAPQVNADWDATSGVAEILHKPDLSQYATQTDLSGKQDVLTAGANITIVNDVISAASSTQLNSDWDATSGVQEILNKPTIPPLKELVAGAGITITDGADSVTISADAGQQVNADWDATSGVAEILNKPVLAAVATTGAYSDLSGKPTIPTATSDLTNDSGFITLSDVPAQVQPDWDATSGLGEILNKPALATVATTGAYSDLSGTPAIPTATSDLTNDSGFITLSDVPAQVQPDWNATSGLGEILNKPSIPVIGTITV